MMETPESMDKFRIKYNKLIEKSEAISPSKTNKQEVHWIDPAMYTSTKHFEENFVPPEKI